MVYTYITRRSWSAAGPFLEYRSLLENVFNFFIPIFSWYCALNNYLLSHSLLFRNWPRVLAVPNRSSTFSEFVYEVRSYHLHCGGSVLRRIVHLLIVTIEKICFEFRIIPAIPTAANRERTALGRTRGNREEKKEEIEKGITYSNLNFTCLQTNWKEISSNT